MVIPEEDVDEYIDLVKKFKNKIVSREEAKREYRNLMVMVAKLYLPTPISKRVEEELCYRFDYSAS